MNCLLIVPQLGMGANGGYVPGGLAQFGRCVARAMASVKEWDRLGVWSLVDDPQSVVRTQEMLSRFRSEGELDIRHFGHSRAQLAAALGRECWRSTYHRVMYLHVHLAVLHDVPGHPVYDVWEIGKDVFDPLPSRRYRALRRAGRVFAISHHTDELARLRNPGIPVATVIHPCVEPEDKEESGECRTPDQYRAERREPAVLIVANMNYQHLYKGHQQLLSAWTSVRRGCPGAELWIVGAGDARADLESRLNHLDPNVAASIGFFGAVDQTRLDSLFRRCRVFAMPSTGEGFGIVFAEAAKYGVPSIGGKYDSVKEIVLHNQTGLLTEQHPHDLALVCVRLLTDDDLAQRLGDNARLRYVREYQFCHFRERFAKAVVG